MTDQNRHIQNDQLQAYLDGDLSTAARETIQSHLETCPSCQDQLARLEDLASQLEELPDIHFSGDVSLKVIAQLREERSLIPALTWPFLAQAVAAGAVVGALIPALQAAGWLPSLLDARLKLQAGFNIFLTQLISGWLVWWEGIKVQVNQLIASTNPLAGLPWNGYSPWLVIGGAGLLIIIFNAVLLRGQPLPRRNHHQV